MTGQNHQGKKNTKKNSATAAIIVLCCIAVFVLILGISFLFRQLDTHDIYTLTYHNGTRVLVLKARNNYILEEGGSQPNCIQAPCEPIVKELRKIQYTDEYRQLFHDVFEEKHPGEKEVTIWHNTPTAKELTDAQHDLLEHEIDRINY